MRRSTWKRLLSGSIAGLATSVAMKAMQEVGMKLMPKQMPPLRQDPGEFMVEKAENAMEDAGEMLGQAVEQVPTSVEKATAQALGVGYGLTFALLFAATRPRVQHVVVEGTVLGLATWAAGYLGWLPAMKLMRPVHRQKPVQVLNGVGSHLAFGLATAALYKGLRRRI